MSKIRITFRDSYKNKQGESPLVVVAHMMKHKVRLSTGISVKPENWDGKKQKIKGTGKEISDNNLILDERLARVNDILVKYRLQHKDITPELLRYEYAHYSASIDFIAFMEAEIKERRSELAGSTIKNHNICLHRLKEFRGEIIFSEIDEALVIKFKAFLRDTVKNDIYTISSRLKVFKTYINRAIKKHIISDNPFRYIPLVRPQVDRVFLTEPEIKKLVALYNKNYLPKSHQKALRHFLFAISTGLRISDVRAITMDCITKNTLVFSPEKTKNKKAALIRVPIQTLAARMIKDESPNRLYGPVFAMLSEFRTNKYIQDAAEVAKIDKKISFHTARHTFATYFLRKTKNLLALQKLLGHTNISETMIYSHILMEDIEAEMKCFEELT